MPGSLATSAYFLLLTAIVIAAVWLARGVRCPPERRGMAAPADATTPVVLFCIAVTLAMRLVEVCAGPRFAP